MITNSLDNFPLINNNLLRSLIKKAFELIKRINNCFKYQTNLIIKIENQLLIKYLDVINNNAFKDEED